MKLRVVGVPQLTLLDFLTKFHELGVPVEYFVKSSLVRSEPKNKLYFGSLTPVFCDDLNLLRRVPKKKVVFLAAPPSEVAYLGIDNLHLGAKEVTNEDLMSCVLQSGELRQLSKLPVRPEEAILKDRCRASVLQKFQSNFYRIKDLDKRKEVQNLTFKYLAGKVKTPPKTEFSFINQLFDSDRVSHLIKAVKRCCVGEDIDSVANEMGLDRFEIAYVLSKNAKAIL